MNKIKTPLLILFSVVILLDVCAKGVSEKGDENASTKTVEMKTITDHAGNIVEIPVDPQRIASLHTLSTTVMLIELEAPLIGVSTRLRVPGNTPYLRSAEELFGIRFEDTDYYNYGTFGGDIEQIKISKPDLIVGRMANLAQYKMLSSIAPTVLIEHRIPNIFKVYKDLATWIGKEKIFDEKYTQYLKRIEQVKKQFTADPATQTVVYLHPHINKGKIYVGQHYGAVTTVAYDLGLQPVEFVKKQFGNDAKQMSHPMSPEVIGEFADTDYILNTYSPMFNQDVSVFNQDTNEIVYNELDIVSLGWRNILQAYKNNTFIVLHRELAYPTSFMGLHYVLDEFEKYIK